MISIIKASKHRWKDEKTTEKSTEEDVSQRQETIQTQEATEQKKHYTKIGRKTTVFQATNKRNLIREKLDMAKKEKR